MHSYFNLNALDIGRFQRQQGSESIPAKKKQKPSLEIWNKTRIRQGRKNMPLTAIFTVRVPTFKSTRLPFKFWLCIVGSVASSPTKIGPLTQGFQVSFWSPRTGSHVLPGSSKWNRTFGKVSREKLLFPKEWGEANQFEWGETSKILFLAFFTNQKNWWKMIQFDINWVELNQWHPFFFVPAVFCGKSAWYFSDCGGTSWNSWCLTP